MINTFLNEPEHILLYTVKYFQVFLSKMNISIYYLSFVYTQLNDSEYYYISLTTQLFFYTQLNDPTVLFLTIQFRISHLFADRFKLYQVLHLQTRVDLGAMAKKRYSIFPRAPLTGSLQSDCLMSYLEHSSVEFYSLAEMQLVYFTAPADWAVIVIQC